MRHSTKAQSALEYIVTHMWALIIIMIVIGVLFWIGVFSGLNASQRASPGQCSVYRPGGPGSLEGTNFVGACNGELPQYVGEYGYNGFSTFVGYSNVSIPTSFVPAITASNKQGVTLTGWVYSFAYHPYETAFMYGNLSVISLASPQPNAIFINVDGIAAGIVAGTKLVGMLTFE